MSFEMKDSGLRESFDGGAVRDVRKNKGRFDLISPIGIRRIAAMPAMTWWADTLAEHLQSVLVQIFAYMEGYREQDYLALAARDLLVAIDVRYSNPNRTLTTPLDNIKGSRFMPLNPIGLKHVALVYEKGAEKYAARNWEKGMPICRILDSAIRHTVQAINGETDEDHLGHAAWNLIAAMHIEEMIERDLMPKTFNDLPNFLRSENEAAVESVVNGAAIVFPEDWSKNNSSN